MVVPIGMLHFDRQNGNAMPEQDNPADQKTALIFAAHYALAIFTTAAAKDCFGDEALSVVTVISGFVDVDAITLSSAQLAAAQRIDSTTTRRVILIASLVNLVFKAGVVLSRRRTHRWPDHPAPCRKTGTRGPSSCPSFLRPAPAAGRHCQDRDYRPC